MCNLYKITAAVEAMPVMLDVADIPRWLESPRVDACELAKSFDDARMRVLSAI